MKVRRSVVVPEYKENEDTVLDRYVCELCNNILKEERRKLLLRRKSKSNSYIYYGICNRCKK